MRSLVATLVAIALAISESAAARPQAEPARVLSTTQPAYPQQAWSARVEGDVRFRATVRADGTVATVDILAVPDVNLGFEEAVRVAVASWRFQPAILNGAATTSEYTGSIRFALNTPGEAIYAASWQKTWDTARSIVRGLGLKVQRADPLYGVLIARGEYDPKRFQLTAQQLNLPPGSFTGVITLHILVAPEREPARVAIGAVFDVVAGNRQISLNRRYGNDDIAQVLLSRLATTMQVRMEPLSANATRRAEQSRALMPPGATDRCSVVPAVLLDKEQAKEATRQPRLVSSVAPAYPYEQAKAGQQGTVWFVAELTEHGTVINPQNTIHADDSGQLVLAAQMAARLWRFRPASKDGCPVRVRINIEQKFTRRN